MDDVVEIGSEEKDINLSQKQEEWKKREAEIQETTDGLGLPLDKGIVEGVVALNLFGFPTSQSCEGHFDINALEHRFKYLNPFIEIAPDNYPWADIYSGELELLTKMAASQGLKVEDVLNDASQHVSIIHAASAACCDNETSETYNAWKKVLDKYLSPLEMLLEEFNRGRTEGDAKLMVQDSMGGIRVLSKSAEQILDINEHIDSYSSEALTLQLQTQQNELFDFGRFLKTKFFTDDKTSVT